MSWGSFDIPDELKVRKLLESMLKYDIELQKNKDKFGYDIHVFRYNTKTNEKHPIGYIELEVSDTWVNDYPRHWKTYSFLARKVIKFDRDKNEFTKELKDNWERTVYLITNKEMSDMICQSIQSISKLKFYYCKVKERYYNDCFFRVRKGSKKIICGKDNCANFIKQFFEPQKIIDEYIETED
jgi:hypothetical protein